MRTFCIFFLLAAQSIQAGALPAWKAGLGIGAGDHKEDRGFIYFQPPLFDALKPYHQRRYPAFALSLQRNVYESTYFDLYLGTHVYFIENAWSGAVWGLNLPLFNNFNYQLLRRSTSPMLELEYNGKWGNSRFTPFASIGAGVVVNAIQYNEQPTGAYSFAATLQSRHNSLKAAFNAGVGISMQLARRQAVFLRYVYQYNGRSAFVSNSSHHSWQDNIIWLGVTARSHE